MEYHNPVLLKESVDGLNIKPDGIYVDVTFGGGGHSKEILSRLNENGKLFGFDQDADAKRNEELNRNLSKRLQQSSKHLDKLRGVLAKIDLTMEAIQDPEGLEERVNNAVNRLIKRIESETSPAPITADADGVSGESSGTDSSSKD